MEFHMINMMYATLPMCAQTEKTIFSCKDDCLLTKRTRCWTYSALRLHYDLCRTSYIEQLYESGHIIASNGTPTAMPPLVQIQNMLQYLNPALIPDSTHRSPECKGELCGESQYFSLLRSLLSSFPLSSTGAGAGFC